METWNAGNLEIKITTTFTSILSCGIIEIWMEFLYKNQKKGTDNGKIG